MNDSSVGLPENSYGKMLSTESTRVWSYFITPEYNVHTLLHTLQIQLFFPFFFFGVKTK